MESQSRRSESESEQYVGMKSSALYQRVAFLPDLPVVPLFQCHSTSMVHGSSSHSARMR